MKPFREFDYSKISDKLCTLYNYKRIQKEVSDVNNDFKTLRTRMELHPDFMGIIHFIQYPNDGAITGRPVCGRIIILKEYPNIPPVVHIFTKVHRYNVDIFNTHAYSLESLHSSSCFDILNVGSGRNNDGSWKSDYTLSALISSLMQSIVSLVVPQQYGADIKEFVTMEKLLNIHKSIDYTYAKYSSLMPTGIIIQGIESFPIKTKSYFTFQNKFLRSNKNNKDNIIISEPFEITDSKCIEIDLKELNNNPSTVFSIILTSDPTDLVGKNPKTILFRNGVTGTAATKKFNKPIIWFYHGKPLNQENVKINVSLCEEFTISYLENDKYIIHGDLPVSFLRSKELVTYFTDIHTPMYLCILLKNKSEGKQVSIYMSEPEYGYFSKDDSYTLLDTI